MSLKDFTLPTISFTDAKGRSFSINDMRPYPKYVTWYQYIVKNGDELDEIASRNDVYGTGAEASYYRIAEHNIATLFDAKFDMNKIKSLNIPLP